MAGEVAGSGTSVASVSPQGLNGVEGVMMGEDDTNINIDSRGSESVSVIFADEPTSGLDSYQAQKVL